MVLLIVYLSIALVFSFLCSLLEASLLSITPSYVRIQTEKKSAISDELNDFKNNVDKPLAAILTLNTFAHTIGAAGVGAQAQIIWGDEYLTLISVILTILILILTEIIPKTLGANYWNQLAGFTVRTIKLLIFILYPIVFVSQLITKKLKRDKDKSILSRADFTAMAEIGTQEGILHQNESRVINNVLRFNNIQAQHIMTPRTVVKAAPEMEKIKTFYDKATTLPYSRIPVYHDSLDSISGYVLKDELLEEIIDNEGNKALNEIKRPFEIVLQHTPIAKLLARLVEKKEHIALVVDEYGGTSGIVTMEDIIETLLGLEITDEFDDVEDLQKWARENWQKRAKNLPYLSDENNPNKEN